jgi:hypothetical protein
LVFSWYFPGHLLAVYFVEVSQVVRVHASIGLFCGAKQPWLAAAKYDGCWQVRTVAAWHGGERDSGRFTGWSARWKSANG